MALRLKRVLQTILLECADLLKKSRPSRIVVVGSCGQLAGRLNTDDLSFGPYWFPLLNYCTTKQCNMLFTVELSNKLKGTDAASAEDKAAQRRARDAARKRAAGPEAKARAAERRRARRAATWSTRSIACGVRIDWSRLGVFDDDDAAVCEGERAEGEDDADDIETVPENIDLHDPVQLAIALNAMSKTIFFNEEGVTVNCCHPGFVRSEIAVRSADMQTWLFNLLLSFYGKTVKEGAETTVYLAVSEDVQNVSGEYFKDCAPTFAVPWATNPAAAKKLYEESIRLTQVI
ncbi:hypothetical protein HPB52_021301 [Rhipicephalus sanguineus]|uniref:Uncharacterized protein n=1 Tax=Rhipicephalus sanguineus TaxID=34632 RepID=A0A9D4Q3A2_RHISA|nr:hypothetical protein HPB52_021301 [Rhipicephalus sanguineus]